MRLPNQFSVYKSPLYSSPYIQNSPDTWARGKTKKECRTYRGGPLSQFFRDEMRQEKAQKRGEGRTSKEGRGSVLVVVQRRRAAGGAVPVVAALGRTGEQVDETEEGES